jgi:hypothetical protein
MTDVPHFDLPFQLGPAGANVVEQDSIEDISNCVIAVASTHIGWRELVPTFGIPDLTLRRQPLGADDISNWIANQEPRAQMVVEESPDGYDKLISRVNLGVSNVAKGGGALV